MCVVLISVGDKSSSLSDHRTERLQIVLTLITFCHDLDLVRLLIRRGD